MKTLNLQDVCLSDYFSGHHLPVFQVVINNKITIIEVIESIKNEYDEMFDYYDSLEINEDDFNKAYNKMLNDNNHQLNNIAFPDLDDDDDSCIGSVYAFFTLNDS